MNLQKINHRICSLILSLFLFSSQALASDSLSYSGRLVNTDGSPVLGPVTIKAELAYTNDYETVLCNDEIPNVTLTKGVFHIKLNFNCSTAGISFTQVLAQRPVGESVAIRITDSTNSKSYSFQAMHSIPYSTLAQQLAQLGATTGQILQWDGSKWSPADTGGDGTVVSVSGTLPISVANGATNPIISMTQANATTHGYLSLTDWNIFNNKQAALPTGGTALDYYGGDNSWHVLNTDAVPETLTRRYFQDDRVLDVKLTGLSANTDPITATDSVLTAIGKTKTQIDTINTDRESYLIKNGVDIISGSVTVQGPTSFLMITEAPLGLTDATNKEYVDGLNDLKVNKAGDTITGALNLEQGVKLKGGENYVTLRGHATSTEYALTLPQVLGENGTVLSTDAAGNLSWVNPSTVIAGSGTVDSASIVNGSILNEDINAAAAIAQSKIAGLTTDLGNKQSTTLANGNILIGSAGNIATANTLSGDATLSNTGVLTLNNTVAANTYKSVTVDTKGRVTAGTNPTTLAGYGITDTLLKTLVVNPPLAKTGTVTDPILTLPKATNTIDGHLSAADWVTFNAKQPAVIATSALNTGSVTTNLQGGVVVKPYSTGAGNTGEIRLQELAINGANYVALKSPDALANNVIFTLPAAHGTLGQALTTNPSGVLSWTTVATGGTTLTGDVEGTINANTIGTGKVTLNHLSATGTKNASTYLAGDYTFKNFNNSVSSIVLSELNTTGITKATSLMSKTDTVSTAFNKLLFTQNDYISKSVDQTINGHLAINPVTGFITVPDPITGKDAANKDYVDSFGKWSKGVGTDIYYNNKVGIGTTTPIAGLHVVGKTPTDNFLGLFAESGITPESSVAGANSGHMLSVQGNGAAYFMGRDVTNDIEFVFGTSTVGNAFAGTVSAHDFQLRTNNITRLSVKETTGNVGIGVTAPSEKLEVNGSVKATAYLYTSDERLKKNITTIDNSLNKILRLRGVEFDWKKTDLHEIGLVAQEVEEIEPDLVVTSSVDGMKSVKYGNLVALLIEAIKEEHQELSETKEYINKLEDEITKLKNEKNKLSADIELIKKHLQLQ